MGREGDLTHADAATAELAAAVERLDAALTGLLERRDTPVLDEAELMRRVGGDPGLLEELVALFLESLPERLAALRVAIEQRDRHALERAAHTLKGSVGNFSARSAFEAALRLEGMGREGDLGQAETAVAALEAEIARLKPALASLFKTPP